MAPLLSIVMPADIECGGQSKTNYGFLEHPKVILIVKHGVPAYLHQGKGNISENTEPHQQLSLARRSVEKMAAMRMPDSSDARALNQNFDYFLVLDFEATCDNEKPPKPQEIIEFPVLKVNARTYAVDSIFHQYVRPLHNPHLTPFCTELTGIVQEMVDNQECFSEVMKNFNQWMESEGLLNPETRSIFVTCGDWDLKSMLPRQCETSNLPTKSYFKKWINIKKSYADITRTFPKGMMHMLTGLNLQHIGRHHSGIDDCRNIANIVVELMRQGYVFRENGRLQ
ncbi:eri1 exoribonuclease 3 [Plakobranchus ocellatus]|uniref:Eri1 exoribonuclease 3 n=1 Tax=Plakobranchus ocellatus TaxID=259542 RepID=A0AAV4AFP9_9GAST|nr:eri1 exoribonuclease 3 [Plakobranchus ocellatus]